MLETIKEKIRQWLGVHSIVDNSVESGRVLSIKDVPPDLLHEISLLQQKDYEDNFYKDLDLHRALYPPPDESSLMTWVPVINLAFLFIVFIMLIFKK